MPKAVLITKNGGPEVLKVTTLKTPSVKEHQLKIKHTVIGVNYIDTYHRSGLYPLPKIPAVPGIEAVGVVTEIGPNTEGFAVGDRIGYATGPVGSYREERVIPANIAVHIPNNIDDETAAASLAKGLTAHYLSRRTYIIVPGQTVLVHAVADGVGGILCQMAKAAGAHVIGTVNTDEKLHYAHEIGCDHIINYKKEDFVEKVREITNSEGVPVVYDGIGQDTFHDSLRCLFMFGTMVSYGYSSGKVDNISLDRLSKKSLFLTCPKLIDYKRNRMELVISTNELFEMIQEGMIKVKINKRYSLEEAPQAHEEMASRRHIGANLIIV